jgi:hypothetical protein
LLVVLFTLWFQSDRPLAPSVGSGWRGAFGKGEFMKEWMPIVVLISVYGVVLWFGVYVCDRC